MAIYAYYKTVGGALSSVSSTIDATSAGISRKEIPALPGPEDVWDKAALQFVPRTIAKVELEIALDLPFNKWQRWQLTLDEAKKRGLPEAVITLLAAKVEAVWKAYTNAIEAWRDAK